MSDSIYDAFKFGMLLAELHPDPPRRDPVAELRRIQLSDAKHQHRLAETGAKIKFKMVREELANYKIADETAHQNYDAYESVKSIFSAKMNEINSKIAAVQPRLRSQRAKATIGELKQAAFFKLIKQIVHGTGVDADLLRAQTHAGRIARVAYLDDAFESGRIPLYRRETYEDALDVGAPSDWASKYADDLVRQIAELSLWTGLSFDNARKWCTKLYWLDERNPTFFRRISPTQEDRDTVWAMNKQRELWRESYEAKILQVPSPAQESTDGTQIQAPATVSEDLDLPYASESISHTPLKTIQFLSKDQVLRGYKFGQILVEAQVELPPEWSDEFANRSTNLNDIKKDRRLADKVEEDFSKLWSKTLDQTRLAEAITKRVTASYESLKNDLNEYIHKQMTRLSFFQSRLFAERKKATTMEISSTALGELVEKIVHEHGADATLFLDKTNSGQNARLDFFNRSCDAQRIAVDRRELFEAKIDRGMTEERAGEFADYLVHQVGEISLWSGLSYGDARKWCWNLYTIDEESPFFSNHKHVNQETRATAAAMNKQRAMWRVMYESNQLLEQSSPVRQRRLTESS